MVALSVLLLALAASPSVKAEQMSLVQCEQDESKPTSREQVERPCLSRYGRVVERKDGSLRLKLENGRVKTLTDISSGCEPPDFDFGKCIHYQFVGYRPAEHLFMVLVGYYEGSLVKLI